MHAMGVYPLPLAIFLCEVGQSNVLHSCTRVKPRVSVSKPFSGWLYENLFRVTN